MMNAQSARTTVLKKKFLTLRSLMVNGLRQRTKIYRPTDCKLKVMGKWVTLWGNWPIASLFHPSKRIAKTTAVTHAVLKKTEELSSHSDTETCSDDSDITEDYKPDRSESPRRKHQKTTYATNLVTGTNVSTSKAAKICRKLSEEGISIPTPSQPAVYKALFKKATQVRRPILNCILRSFDVGISLIDERRYERAADVGDLELAFRWKENWKRGISSYCFEKS